MLLLTVLSLGLRLPDLDADPPVAALGRQGSTQISGAFLSDEGWYSRNARRHALGEGWFTEEGLNPIVVTPLFSLLQRLSFACLGVSLSAARTAPALLGASMPPFLFLALLPCLGHAGAFAAALLLAVNFPLVMYSRLALTEVPYLSLTLLSVLLLLAAYRLGRQALAISGGLVFAAACAVKLSALALLPVAAVHGAAIWWMERRTGQTSGKVSAMSLLLSWAGAAAAAGGLALRLWLPQGGEEAAYQLTRLAGQRSGGLGDLIGRTALFLTEGALWVHWPVLVALSGGVVATGLGAVLLQFHHRDRPQASTAEGTWSRLFLDPALLFFALWFLMALAVLAVTAYRPLRYHLMLLPAACALAGTAFHLAWRVPGAKLRKIGLLTLLAAATGLELSGWARWYVDRRHTVVGCARQVGTLIRREPGTALVLGRVADTLALENHLGTLNLPVGVPVEDISSRLELHRPTHLLLLRQRELGSLVNRYPETFTGSREMGAFRMLESYYTGEPLRLYRLRPRSGP